MTNDHSVPSPPKCVNAAHGCPCVAFNLIGEACCKTCSDGKICLYATTHDDSPHRALANQYVKDPATYDQVRIFDVTFPTCKVQYCQSVIADCNQERCIYHIVQPTSFHEPSQGWPTCSTVGCGCVGYRGREGDVCSKSCRERGPCKSVYHPFPSGLREHRHKQVQKRMRQLTANVPSPDLAPRAVRPNSPTKGSIIKPVLQKLAGSFERCPLRKFNCPAAAEYSQLRDDAQQLAYGGLSLLPKDHDADTRWKTVCELVTSQPFRLTSVQMLDAVNEMAQLILRRLPDDWSESTRPAYKILSLIFEYDEPLPTTASVPYPIVDMEDINYLRCRAVQVNSAESNIRVFVKADFVNRLNRTLTQLLVTGNPKRAGLLFQEDTQCLPSGMFQSKITALSDVYVGSKSSNARKATQSAARPAFESVQHQIDNHLRIVPVFDENADEDGDTDDEYPDPGRPPPGSPGTPRSSPPSKKKPPPASAPHGAAAFLRAATKSGNPPSRGRTRQRNT